MSWQSWLTSASTIPANPRLPTRREEEWKYVSLRWLENWNFKPALKDHVEIDPISDDFDEIVLSNGFLQSEVPEGLHLEVIRKDDTPSARFQTWFTHFDEDKAKIVTPHDLFEDLNQVRFPEGFYLEIPDGTVCAKPIVFRWVNTSGLGTRYPRLWVKVGKRSKLVLVESFESSSNTEALSVPVAEIEVKESSKLEYTRVVKGALQNAQIGRTRILLQRDASLESLSFAMGSKLVRHNLDVFMCGQGASARLQGLSYTGGKQVVDHHTRVDHVVGECVTTQLYKSVLAGSSCSVFNGNVVIRHEAQKASSEQLNQNLLLSSKAEVDSKPELEIWADDVKATHGSTVGQLNEEEVFYFLSRAIPRSEAESMIRRGFTQDLLMQVSDPAVQRWILGLQNEADQRLLV
jgi:Fe-S cluster assembly protein SufD